MRALIRNMDTYPEELRRFIPLSISHETKEVEVFIIIPDDEKFIKRITFSYGVFPGSQQCNVFMINGAITLFEKTSLNYFPLSSAEYEQRYAKYKQWHLMYADGPMDYLETTLFWALEKSLKFAKDAAKWEEMTEADIEDYPNLKTKLLFRLPLLVTEFKKDIEELGFIF